MPAFRTRISSFAHAQAAGHPGPRLKQPRQPRRARPKQVCASRRAVTLGGLHCPQCHACRHLSRWAVVVPGPGYCKPKGQLYTHPEILMRGLRPDQVGRPGTWAVPRRLCNLPHPRKPCPRVDRRAEVLSPLADQGSRTFLSGSSPTRPLA